MNPSLTAADLDGLRPGQHLCWSYQDPIAFRRGLARFVNDGFARGERVVAHLAADQLDAVTAALYNDVPSAKSAQAAGGLRLLTARDVYLADGRFEPQQRLVDVEELTQRALADGYTALRSLLQASDLRDNRAAVTVWPSCELRSDFLVARQPTTLVCAYDARVCRGSTMHALRAVHAIEYGRFLEESRFGIHAGLSGNVTIRGEIDLNDSDTVVTLGCLAAAAAVRPIVDVTRLRFADVSGMRALRRIVEAMHAVHGLVLIHGASPTIRRVWHLLELDRDIDATFSSRGEDGRSDAAFARAVRSS